MVQCINYMRLGEYYIIAITYVEQVCCIAQFQHYWWQQLLHNNQE